jgi:predicted  nucleic acid-binding Zn-ribbon protein
MSSDPASSQAAPQSPAAQLFQKAHQKMVTLSRVDEQIAQLMSKRKTLQEELREVQLEINGEFERMIQIAEQPPAVLRAEKIELPRRNGEARFAADRIDAEPATT